MSSRRIVQVSTIVVLTMRTAATLTQFASQNNTVHFGTPLSPPRTSAKVELVRVVRRESGTSVAEAAEKLSVAPNTVSTLDGQFSDADQPVEVARAAATARAVSY